MARPKGLELVPTAHEGLPWYALPDWWVAGATIMLAIATGGLWIVTWRLWNSTKILVSDERSHAERELRAYISVEPGGINYAGTPGQCMGHIAVRNVGKLPASNVFVESHIKMGQRDAPLPDVALDPKSIQRVIQPGALMRQGTVEIDSPFPDPILGHVFVWGVAYYDDGYGRRRFTRFCHRYHPKARTIRALRSIHDAAPREIISPEEGRYHTEGNDAD